MLISATAAANNTKALWYLTRGTGMVTLILLTASLVLGIVQVNRWASPRWPRFVTAALHSNISLLSCAFLGAHIVTAIADGFAPIRWLDAVVPFRSAYRPLWLGLGAVATDLLIALIVTSLLRGRLGYRAWKAVHWAAYACWPVAVFHGLGTGSDSAKGWALLVYAACVGLVVSAVWWRLAKGWSRERAGQGLVAVLGSALLPLVVLGFVAQGPLKSGWAARAGTPPKLIAHAATPSSAVAHAASPTPFTGAFTDQLSGSLSQQGDDGSGITTVTIDAALSGAAPGTLHITLTGQAADGGGVALASSTARVGPQAHPDLLQGSVSSLRGSSLGLAVQDRSGRALTLFADLQITGSTVSGTLRSAG